MQFLFIIFSFLIKCSNQWLWFVWITSQDLIVLKNGAEQASLISQLIASGFFIILNGRVGLKHMSWCASMLSKILTEIMVKDCRLLERRKLVICVGRLGYSVIGHSYLQCGPKGWASYYGWTVPHSWILFSPMLEMGPLSWIISFRFVNFI